MDHVIALFVSTFGIFLIIGTIKAFSWLLKRQERKRRRALIVSRQFRFQYPYSPRIRCKFDSFDEQDDIWKSNSDSLDNSEALKSDLELVAHDKCVICLDRFTQGDQFMVKRCGHVFHEYCILTWLDTDNVCPLCRVSVDERELDYLVHTMAPSGLPSGRVTHV